MKCKVSKKVIIISAVALCVVYLLASTLSENGSLSAWSEKWRASYREDRVSSSDEDWEIVETDRVVLENENVRLELDGATTHFQVTNKPTGQVYTSYPVDAPDEFDEEAQIKISSNLSVVYYDANSTGSVMGSGPDCVEKGNFLIKRQGDTVRIYYTLGSSANQIFAPAVCSQEVFEKQILERLSSNSRRRRLSAYYTLYVWDEQDAEVKEMAKKYPILKETPLYVLQDNLSDSVLQEITTFVTQSGFTKDDYAAECAQLGIEVVEPALPVGFVIPLELSLTNDGFSARVLTDKISATNPDYQLQTVSLLDYFGACAADTEGYFVVPDGSGALIDLEQSNASTFVQKMYANDGAISSENQQQLSRNLTLPVFGFRQAGEGFLAIVEEAAATATLSAEVVGPTNNFSHISASFDLIGMDQTNIGQDRNIPLLNLYAGHLSYDHPTIRYVLLDGDNSSYSGMAVRYREYLMDTGVLTKETVAEEIPLYLDVLCMYQQKGDSGSLTASGDIVLSDFEQVDALVQQLHQKGLDRIDLRLKGYGPDGLDSGPQAGLAVDRKLGTVDQLRAIQKRLEEKGGKLFLDFNVMFVGSNKPFDSFRSAVDGAQDLNRETVLYRGFDMVTLVYNASLESRMAVSPAAYRRFADKALSMYSQNFSESHIGIGLSDVGQYLYSDFSKKADYDLNMTAAAITDVIQYIQEKGGCVLTDYGNYYSLAADHIVGAPSDSSMYNMETGSIPFYQIVVHGYKSYANEPFNLVGMQPAERLDLLEAAGAPYVVWTTQDDLVYTDTDFGRLNYSLQFQNSLDALVEYYQEYVALYQDLQALPITGHRLLDNAVSAVDYADGSTVYINRGTKPYTIENVRVDAGKAVRITPEKGE